LAEQYYFVDEKIDADNVYLSYSGLKTYKKEQNEREVLAVIVNNLASTSSITQTNYNHGARSQQAMSAMPIKNSAKKKYFP
jgi:hypothetical protein